MTRRRPKPYNPVLEKIALMREVMIQEKKKAPLTISKSAVQELRAAARENTTEDVKLRASMERLDAGHVLFGINEKKTLLRVLFSEADKTRAVRDGFLIWSPRDMYEYIFMLPHLREQMRKFKNIFGAGPFEWKEAEK
jgi:hypothetical protein